MEKEILNVAKKHTAFPLVYIVYSWKRGKQNSYMCVCVRACGCDYRIEKYKRKMDYHQKNNSNVKTFERLKNIKES